MDGATAAVLAPGGLAGLPGAAAVTTTVIEPLAGMVFGTVVCDGGGGAFRAAATPPGGTAGARNGSWMGSPSSPRAGEGR